MKIETIPASIQQKLKASKVLYTIQRDLTFAEQQCRFVLLEEPEQGIPQSED